MTNWFFDMLRARLRRREWVANRADPTQVVRWDRAGVTTWGRVTPVLHLKIVTSWGVEAEVTVLGHTWRTYDSRLCVWLYGGLEDSYARAQAGYDEDPMGPLSRYA